MARDSIDDLPGKNEEEELRNEISRGKKDDPGPEPEKDVVINVDDIDDDAPAPKGDRQEGRNSRYWMNRRQREEYEENIRRRDEQIAALQQQTNLILQSQQQLLQRQAPQKEYRDPIDDEVDHLANRIELIRNEYKYKAANGQATPDEVRRMEKELQKVELQIMEKMAVKATRGAVPQGDPQQAALKAHIDMTYPDVVGNPAAIRWATGYETQQLAMGRRPSVEEIMSATRKQFRMGQHSHGAPKAPPAYMADRLAGTPRGATGGNSDGPRQVVMTKELKRMANARFPHITDDRKRWEAFAREQADED